jgi:hypothetical protein
VSLEGDDPSFKGDDPDYFDQWSTQSGGGSSGQQITCGTGRIVANDIDPSAWLGDGAVTLTIGAIVEPPSGANQLMTLAELTVHFVQ